MVSYRARSVGRARAAGSSPQAWRAVGTLGLSRRDGGLLGYVLRFDGADGKQFRPLALYAPGAGGAPVWRWEAWPVPRPLYGIDRLAARKSALVIICEGEKSADAAGRLLPDFVCVTTPNGSKSAAKADLSPLRGRDVTIWRDADAPGLEYARALAALCYAAGAASVAIVAPPGGVKEGWDAADAEAEGWTPARALDLVGAAEPFESPRRKARKKAKPKKSAASRSVICSWRWSRIAFFGTRRITKDLSPLPSTAIAKIGRYVRRRSAVGSPCAPIRLMASRQVGRPWRT